MTNNQLTYWANIERERANRASEALEKSRIAAQRYAARLSYAASVYGAKMAYAASKYSSDNALAASKFNAGLNYFGKMKEIKSNEATKYAEIAEKARATQQKYDEMWFKKYGMWSDYYQTTSKWFNQAPNWLKIGATTLNESASFFNKIDGIANRMIRFGIKQARNLTLVP